MVEFIAIIAVDPTNCFKIKMCLILTVAIVLSLLFSGIIL